MGKGERGGGIRTVMSIAGHEEGWALCLELEELMTLFIASTLVASTFPSDSDPGRALAGPIMSCA